VSVLEGDGAGYDILSFHVDGTAKHIEVKTTTRACDSDFFVSANRSRLFGGQSSGLLPLSLVSGALIREFSLLATQFRAQR